MGNVNFWSKKDKQLDEAKANSHYHSNKDVLDKISQSSLDDWDAKQTTTGDLKNNITTFTASENRTNITTGEKLGLTLGKISKFLLDLKALSFKDKVDKSDLETELVTEIEDKYTKNEVDNKFSTLESSLDWKESVPTFDDIASIYPNPQDGWTVNVMDTNFTFRYDGKEWIAISANAIPKATQSVDGLLTKEDKKVLDDNKSSRHNHSNKTILDTITQNLLTNWNSAYTHISDTKKHINSDDNGNVTISGILTAVGGFKYNGVGLDSRYLKTISMPSNFNINTIKEQGIYTAELDATAQTIVGRPWDKAFTIIAISNTGSSPITSPTIQIAFCYVYDTIKIRRKSDYTTNNWNNWFEIITDKNSSKFAKAGLINSSNNGLNYLRNDMLPTEFPNGLNVYSIYNSGFPCGYGDLISIGLRAQARTQLFLEWRGTDKARGRILYRNSRDTGVNEFSPWGQLAEINDLNTLCEPKQSVTTITKSLKLTTAWLDTGINLNYPTGTYILQVTIADNTIFYSTVLSGIVSMTSVDSNSANESDKNEIPLHCISHSTNGITIHLRSCGHANGVNSLQIKYSGQPAGNLNIINVTHQMTFKLKKII